MLKDSYLDYVIDSLSFCAKEISYRKMFGGYGIYYHGVMMGLLAKNELYFKVDDSNRDKYEERKSVPFTYEKKDKTVTMSYWKLP
jgi:DNA transformation protein